MIEIPDPAWKGGPDDGGRDWWCPACGGWYAWTDDCACEDGPPADYLLHPANTPPMRPGWDPAELLGLGACLAGGDGAAADDWGPDETVGLGPEGWADYRDTYGWDNTNEWEGR